MEVSRRKFMLGAGAIAAAPAVLGDAQKVFKVGLVGCGGRGTGAIQNIMDAAARLGCKVELTATADFFPDKAKAICKKYGVDEKMAFSGANGYKNVIASGSGCPAHGSHTQTTCAGSGFSVPCTP